jgi:trehalose 6-phosphate phosphatase
MARTSKLIDEAKSHAVEIDHETACNTAPSLEDRRSADERGFIVRASTRGSAQTLCTMALPGALQTTYVGFNKIRIQEDERGIVLIGDIDLCNSAVLLDVDGTILDIAATPRGVAVPRRLKRALKTLWRGTSGAVAFVSGRPLGDLDRLFAPLRLAAIAGHGAEVRVSANDQPSRNDTPIDNDLRGQFQAFASKVDGIILEDKGYSLALHYRLAPEHAEMVREVVAAACAVYPKSAIEVLLGKAVIEVKSSAFNKGTGLRMLMMHPPFRGRRPVFIGDDVTDESAFAVLPEFDGVGFSVGRPISGLAGCFAQPNDVRKWLYRIAGADEADHP